MGSSKPPGADGSIVISRFSTENLAAADRYECWRARSHSATGRTYETVPYQPFGADAAVVALGTLAVSFINVSGQHFERSHALIAADGIDNLAVNVRFKGGARGDMNGRDLRAGEGSIVLTDLAQPQQHVSDASSTAYFVVPRALAEQFLPDVSSLHGLTIEPEAATLLREHMLQIWRNADNLPAEQGARLGRTVMDLLAVAVAQAQGGLIAPETSTTAALARARAEIEARLGSATLNVASLCRSLGMSRSALYRLFEPDGVQAYIMRRRLDRVATALRDPLNPHRIAEIADQWGFCDAAYLGRVFRQRFGMTPGEFRAFSRDRAA